MAAAIDVRNVHSAVGTDESVASFGDEHAILAANHSAALAQRQFNNAGIEVVFLCPGGRSGGRFGGREIDEAAFGFLNYFVFDDENVSGLEYEFVFRQRLENFVCQRIAGFDFVGQSNGDETNFGGRIVRYALPVFFKALDFKALD